FAPSTRQVDVRAKSKELYQLLVDKSKKDKRYGFRVTMSTESDFCKSAAAFLRKKEQLQQSGKPSAATVAFHYTNGANLDAGIRKEGLRMKNARNGAFGRGIYVGNNEEAFSNMGDTGIMVLVLTGSQKKMSMGSDHSNHGGCDSLVGNKKDDKFWEETVLLSDAQVLPLVCYSKWLKDDTNSSVWTMQKVLQKWADSHLPSPNGPPKLQRILHPYTMATMPKMTLSPAPPPPTVCLVGLEFFNPSETNSSHFFGQVPVGTTGPSPSGIMTVSESSTQSCDGFDNSKLLILTYNIPNGVQDRRHPQPGKQFVGGSCTTYLPNNRRGRELMRRLKLAFACGQVFTVDSNGNLRWNITPQKTALTGGGEAGFPENGFLEKTKQSLDALKIRK
ncbi:MAG: hypothetical protein SGILL_007479, partial [Bacillariaceae sp.]